MSVEAHKCNVPGCKGFIVFENADFELDKPPLVEGVYQFASPTCTECGKQYKVVPSYVVVSVDEDGGFEKVQSACITEWEAREKRRKFEIATDPLTRVQLFLKDRNYSYTASEVITEFSRYTDQGPYYLSHSMKDCFLHLEDDLKVLLEG